MIHTQVSISAEHQTVVTFELVGVNNTASADLLGCQPQQGLGGYIRNNRHLNDIVSLQNPSNRNLPGSTSAPFSLAPATEITLIQLNLSVQQSFSILSLIEDRPANSADGPIHCSVRHAHLQRHFPNGHFQFKELDQRAIANTSIFPGWYSVRRSHEKCKNREHRYLPSFSL